MNKLYALSVAALLIAPCAVAQKTITGFTGQSLAAEIKAETQFDQSLSAQRIGETIKLLSSQPHHIGSPGGKADAGIILEKLKSYGFDAHIETYNVLFPTPKTRVLEMTGPTKYTAILKEPALKEDATSGQDGQLPIYNAWSADGDVTAELVFVNYGIPEDYEKLDAMGISVKGKIVIAKYGHSWRGIKPKVAQEHGAIGCIIYSDPKDDGYYQGDVYPKGAFKNEYGAQRGSVMDMVIYPGDPLTPGIGATKDAVRLKRENATNLLKIPVLPISYHDAQPLLAALEGPVAPDDWRGALPFTYHVGPGKAVVHLKLEFDWKMVPAYDVIGMVKGSAYPDEWVVRGNHHDAWVNGAGDPLSGQAAMDDEAKAIGDLLKTGWKPKRTLVYCAWDGEEPGLMGSTEWAEDHGKELQQKAVVYINSDGNGRGFLGASGSHALEGFVDEIAHDVTDPQTKVSVYERSHAREIVNAATSKAKKEAMERKTIRIGAMGSGSDYSSFLQHLGVPSLDFGFGGEDPGGEYHSVYDSYDDYVRFKDPNFQYGVALAQTAGRAALRMANADLLPFDFRSLYKTINRYSTEVADLTDAMRENTSVDNQAIRANNYQLAADPTKSVKPPVAKADVPYLDFSPLQNALHKLEKSANDMAEIWSKATKTGGDNEALNKKLYQAEQQLLSADGLPRRGWYKHTIYAPGFYTGYGVKTLPGIREAIEQRNFTEAQQQIVVVAQQLNRLADYLSASATPAMP
ncbi:folate hydrolase [Mucilaginibacter sp. PPCGB 2223]|uniref:transferrin receptor-like dimerization domain-containing protein n=1 Tax=Mucilaginibacter sp. PPCGB 2223 TaxID=1886027 RepID=UPI000824BF5E|nr:transferrin receptor-like dimerization domain-containing protein [Mucilaginibacter sp. PPCGB 2223]OCX52197.1 folate hydrolase [Mucilaginibacter sp. PPCGB 2223]